MGGSNIAKDIEARTYRQQEPSNQEKGDKMLHEQNVTALVKGPTYREKPVKQIAIVPWTIREVTSKLNL